MKFLAVVIIPMIVTYCQAEKLLDYRLFVQPRETPKNCTGPGLFCETCTSLVTCVKDEGSDTWTKHPWETCKSPEKCIDGECSAAADPFCDGTAYLAFICKDVGIYPDPFFCNRFVLCVKQNGKLQPYYNECPKGYGYNIEIGLCNVELSDDRDSNSQCRKGEYPIPLCTEDTIGGALEQRPNEYYICEQYPNKNVLYPVIYRCSPDEIFSDSILQCSANPETTTEDYTPTTSPMY